MINESINWGIINIIYYIIRIVKHAEGLVKDKKLPVERLKSQNYNYRLYRVCQTFCFKVLGKVSLIKLK